MNDNAVCECIVYWLLSMCIHTLNHKSTPSILHLMLQRTAANRGTLHASQVLVVRIEYLYTCTVLHIQTEHSELMVQWPHSLFLYASHFDTRTFVIVSSIIFICVFLSFSVVRHSLHIYICRMEGKIENTKLEIAGHAMILKQFSSGWNGKLCFECQ